MVNFPKNFFVKTSEYLTNYESVNRKLFVASAYPGTDLFKDEIVRQKLSKTFDIHFDQRTKEVIPDHRFKNYVEELDDASKVLVGEEGTLYYGEMDMEQFLQAREYVDSGDIYKILEM